MKKNYKVCIRYTNFFSMPVVVKRRISADELEELMERKDIELISVIDMNTSKKLQ